MQIYERLNLNNPILSDQRERSVGIAKPLLLSVSKTRHIEKYEQESVILCTRALRIGNLQKCPARA